MVIKILTVIVVLIAALVVYTAMKPAEFQIERMVSIAAPPATIFPYMNSAKKFEVWNPFTKDDKDVKMSFSGLDDGLGSKAAWESKKSGTGNSEIVESVTNEHVLVHLHFFKPFKGEQFAKYSVRQEANGTSTATWRMTGKSAFIPRLICNFVNMDRFLGGQMEKGLGYLKAAAEADAAKK